MVVNECCKENIEKIKEEIDNMKIMLIEDNKKVEEQHKIGHKNDIDIYGCVKVPLCGYYKKVSDNLTSIMTIEKVQEIFAKFGVPEKGNVDTLVKKDSLHLDSSESTPEQEDECLLKGARYNKLTCKEFDESLGNIENRT